MSRAKPILCLDFDGVLHSYTSGWKGAATITDPPVAGAMAFIWEATDDFTVAVYSSRSKSLLGRWAMQRWLARNFYTEFGHDTHSDDKMATIKWPFFKPAALVTIDDRAITFTGEWPSMRALKEFKPWNKS